MSTCCQPEAKLAVAKKNCLRNQCVKTYTNPIEQPKLFKTSFWELRDYGCSIAVDLYLRFNLDVTFCFLLMGLVAMIPAMDNYQRNTLRNQCRRALDAGEAVPAACGFGSLPVRDNIPELAFFGVTDLGLFGLGTCEEYDDAQTVLLPVEKPDPFVSLPDAEFCTESNIASYCEVANVLIFLGFLLRCRRKQVTAVKHTDSALWTAADYAVMIDGLFKGEEADDERRKSEMEVARLLEEPGAAGLEARLYADLAALGFPRESIDHIEVARECRQEVEIAKKLDPLWADRAELAADRDKAAEEGDGEKAEELQGKMDEVDGQIGELRAELQALQSTARLSTGHAFVVFQLEESRNRLVKLFRRSLKQRLAYRYFGDGAPPPRLPLSCGEDASPELSAAPEPSDVYWENLTVPESTKNYRLAVTYTRTALMLLCTMICYTAIKISKAKVTAGAGLVADAASKLDPAVAAAIVDSYSIGMTIIVFVANVLLKKDITAQTMTEGHQTRTEYERSLFTKLAGAYVLNSVFLPITIGMATSYMVSGDKLLTQDWYEDGGVVYQGIYLILFLPLYELMKVFPYSTFLSRYVYTIFAQSQKKLNELWMPPPMYLGYLYSSAVMSVSLCMFYAPLYPPAYLLCAFAHLCNFWGTKFAIVFWYRRPPALDDEIYARMVDIMTWVTMLHLLIKALGLSAVASGPDSLHALVQPWLFASGVWFLYAVVPLDSMPCLRAYDQIESGENDTGGIRYDQVQAVKGYAVERYVCPAARRTQSISQIEQLYRGIKYGASASVRRLSGGAVKGATAMRDTAYPVIGKAANAAKAMV